MNNLSFAQLCSEYASIITEITRLQTLLPQYRSDEHPYILDQQLQRKEQLKEEIKRRLVGGK
jgi:hypothetical protein